MSDYPAWIADVDDDQVVVDVDQAALPDDWRARPLRGRMADETPAEMANRVRAAVAEGLADRGLLAFADRLAERGA